MKRKSFLWPILSVSLLFIALSSSCGSAPLMVEKNLFSRSRKPPSAEPHSAERERKTILPFKWIQLDGVMIRGNTRKALVRLKGRGLYRGRYKVKSPFLVVQEGEVIGDYRVTRINLRSIQLKRGEEQYLVTLLPKESRIVSSESMVVADGEVLQDESALHEAKGSQTD